MDKKQKEEAVVEIQVLKSLRHPYIVTYRESFMDKRQAITFNVDVAIDAFALSWTMLMVEICTQR